jgi:hypothetical protein
VFKKAFIPSPPQINLGGVTFFYEASRRAF